MCVVRLMLGLYWGYIRVILGYFWGYIVTMEKRKLLFRVYRVWGLGFRVSGFRV